MKEYYELIKKHMKNYSTEELKQLREELTRTGKMNDQLLNVFNEELIDRTCNRENEKSK